MKATAVVTGGSTGTRSSGTMTDVGSDFDPAAYAIHPIFRTGFNQPSTSANSSWDTLKGRIYRNSVATGWGLTNTFVDGWSTTSRVTCSDCHNNDSWSASESSGPHGSSNPWLLRGINTGIKVTVANPSRTGVLNPVVNTPNASIGLTTNFCLNCHRGDVYGDGNAGEATYGGSLRGTDHEALSRVSHLGGGLRTNCDDWTFLQHMPTGCNNCHGGRPNDGARASGLIHGSAMGRGDGNNNTGGASYLVQDGTLVAQPMGYRFMNGASWDAHRLGQAASTEVGCSTIDASDNYSSCTQHTGFTPDSNPNGNWGQNATPNYWY